MMQKAQREAEAVLKDAEVKAKEVIHNALTSKQKATTDLGRIKQAEEEFRGTFKALLEGHLRSLSEFPVPEDVKLMMGQAGEETVARGRCLRARRRASRPPSRSVVPVAAARSTRRRRPMAAPMAAPGPSAEPRATPAVVASLHLGDLGTPDLEPDATMEFDVAEFGFGERDEDVDIEEID